MRSLHKRQYPYTTGKVTCVGRMTRKRIAGLCSLIVEPTENRFVSCLFTSRRAQKTVYILKDISILEGGLEIPEKLPFERNYSVQFVSAAY